MTENPEWPKEPWEARHTENPVTGYGITRLLSRGFSTPCIAVLSSSTEYDSRAGADRILACVNACASIPDPEAWRAAVERVVGLATDLAQEVRANDQNGEVTTFYNTCANLLDALDALAEIDRLERES